MTGRDVEEIALGLAVDAGLGKAEVVDGCPIQIVQSAKWQVLVVTEVIQKESSAGPVAAADDEPRLLLHWSCSAQMVLALEAGSCLETDRQNRFFALVAKCPWCSVRCLLVVGLSDALLAKF